MRTAYPPRISSVQRPLRLIGTSVAIVALLGAACAPAAPAPTSAPAKPTEVPKPGAAAPATSASPAAAKPAASPVASPAAAKPGAPGQRGGVLRASTLGGGPKVLHPYPESQAYTSPWTDADTLMNAYLVSINFETLEWQADPNRSLARELPKISSDGRVYTYTLRDDIKWSDGKPITSADFQFAWDNASKKENNWVSYSTTVERIESVRTPDAKTVEFTLKQPLAKFLGINLTRDVVPVPKHVWEGKPWLDAQANPEVVKPTVVSGPYLPKELTAERHTYTRNPNYWGKQPNLDEISFIQANPQTIVELLKTRQVEWAQNVPPAQWEDTTKQPNINAVRWSGGIGTYRVMQYNLKRPFLSDKRVRQALAHTINRDDLVQFEDGLATPQFGLYPTNNTWSFDGVNKYAFDMNRARQLLQDAGYRMEGGALRGSDGQPVKLEILWPTTSAPRGKIATYLQQQWKPLGIETTVTGMEFNAMVDKYQRQKDFDIVMGTWGQTSPDPDGVKSQFTTDGTQNAGGYSNPRVDELFQQGAVEQDDNKRRQIYNEIQQLVIEDLSQYSMITLDSTTAFDKRVQGVRPLKGNDILTRNNGQFAEWSLSPQ